MYYLLISIMFTTIAILIFSICHLDLVVAQSDKQTGGSSSNQSRATIIITPRSGNTRTSRECKSFSASSYNWHQGKAS